MEVRAPTDGPPPPAAGKGGCGGPRGAPAPSHPGPAPRPLGIATGVVAAVPLLVGVRMFPCPVLAVLLALYGTLPSLQPLAWPLLVPVLLPVLGLSPITRRLPLDAFDLTVLTTLAVGCTRSWGAPRRPGLAHPFRLH